eukprot:538592_1
MTTQSKRYACSYRAKQQPKQSVNLRMSNSVHGGKGLFRRSGCGGKRPLSTRCLPNNKVHSNNANTDKMYNNYLRTMVNNNTNNNNHNHQINIFEMCDNMNGQQARKTMISYFVKKNTLDITHRLDFNQKEELQRGINMLNTDHFDQIINMLENVIPKNIDDEFELDIDSIDHKLQIKMYNYMLKAIKEQQHQHNINCNNNINNDNDDNKTIEHVTNHKNTSHFNNRKRKMKFVENSENKKKKYNDYNKDITKYLKKIKTIQDEMGEYVLNREMQMQQVTDEKEENVKKINNLKNIIENNKNKETELIEKCNLFERKNMQQQTQIEILMHQKQTLESNCLKWDTLYKDSKKRLSNEKQLTKQLNQKIININKANKRIKKSVNELQKQNEELNGKINLFNGESDRINVLTV